MQDLKDAYKRAKENNKKTGAKFPTNSTQIDEILGCRYGTKYSRMDQVEFMDDSLLKI